MIRTMLDTDRPFDLTLGPIRANVLATYADLVNVHSLAGLVQGWPVVVLIDRGLGDPLGKASVIDIETGTHVPGDAAAWYDRRHAAGARYLATYCSRSTLPAVNHAMGARVFYRWIATLDGTAHIDGYQPGLTPAAVQILGAAQLGFHADLSLVLEDGWNPAPAPAPAPVSDTKWISEALSDVAATQHNLGALAALLGAHQ